MENEQELLKELKQFENKWVAIVDDKVVADGDSVIEVKRKAEEKGIREFAYYLVPRSDVLFAP